MCNTSPNIRNQESPRREGTVCLGRMDLSHRVMHRGGMKKFEERARIAHRTGVLHHETPVLFKFAGCMAFGTAKRDCLQSASGNPQANYYCFKRNWEKEADSSGHASVTKDLEEGSDNQQPQHYGKPSVTRHNKWHSLDPLTPVLGLVGKVLFCQVRHLPASRRSAPEQPPCCNRVLRAAVVMAEHGGSQDLNYQRRF